jgi:hypothetical protein
MTTDEKINLLAILAAPIYANLRGFVGVGHNPMDIAISEAKVFAKKIRESVREDEAK